MGTGRGSGKGKSKGKSRRPETFFVVEEKDTRKHVANSRLQRYVETRTHTRLKRMQMNQVQKSLSKQFWCMAVQDTVENDHCDHMEKHEGSSEHRDESKLEKSSRTSRRIKNHQKRVVTNVETGQNLEKWSRRSRWTSKTQAENRVQDIQRIRVERLEGSKIGKYNS